MAPYKINDRALSWVPPEQIEEQALDQIRNISRMPFVFRHVAVMPDCHFGMGATVGSCIPTKDAIIPAAVGVDIGCGMIAVKTSLNRTDMPEDLSDLRVAIESRIPLSAGRYNGRVRKTARPRVELLEEKAGDRLPFYDKLSKNWRRQVGSLGFGQPLHRDRSGRERGRMGIPALRLARHRKQDSHPPHPQGEGVDGCGESNCRTRTWPT